MTDQQRADSIEAGARAKAITPNIDAFVEEGVTFSNAYCPSPHCCPSRATFLTGLYPSQHGVWNNVNVPNALSRGFDEGVEHWSEHLRDGGYRMYFAGKWHVSAVEGPQDRGWDTRTTLYGEESNYPCRKNKVDLSKLSDWKAYESLPLVNTQDKRKEGVVIRPGYGQYIHYGTHADYFGDEAVVEDACRAIRDYGEETEPWCVYAGTLGPHDPYFAPKEFLDLYPKDSVELPENFEDLMHDKPALYRRTRSQFSQLTRDEHSEALRHYLAFCSYQDHLFGKVLGVLKETGQSNDTIVVFCSDHGDYGGEHGLWTKGLPCFKGAYRVPLVVRDPRPNKMQAGSRVDAFVSLADISPSVSAWSGIDIPNEGIGRSLEPLMEGAVPEDWRDSICTQSNGNELYGIQRSIITKNWKFVYNGYDYDELYDLAEDPEEMNNLIAGGGHVSLADEGMRRIWEFAKEVDDKNTNDYIMVSIARLGPRSAFDRLPVDQDGFLDE